MTTENERFPALIEISAEAKKTIKNLPDGLTGQVDVRNRHVYLEISKVGHSSFVVVLGDGAPEIIFDGRFVRFELIGEDMDDQLEFTKNTASKIIDFLSSGRTFTEGRTWILRKEYRRVPLFDGSSWRLRHT